ncbi:MAG TPA: hypothetical protein VJ780_03245 [Flavobacterium sp.]|nr:hypothetical protein [Flavobacterium sp.]
MKKHLHFAFVFLVLLITSCATDKLEVQENYNTNPENVWAYDGDNTVLKKVIQELKNGTQRESLERKLAKNEVIWNKARFNLIDGKKWILVPFLSEDKENVIGVLTLVKNKKGNTIADMTVRTRVITKNNTLPFWDKSVWLGYFMALDKNILDIKNGNPGFKSSKNQKALAQKQVCGTYEVETIHYTYGYSVSSSGETTYLGEQEPYSTYEYYYICYEVPDDPTPTDPGTGDDGSGNGGTSSPTQSLTTIEDRIIDLITDPCTSEVFTKLKNLNNGDISTMLNRFRANGTIFDLNISIGNVTQSGNEAETKIGINHDTANIVLNQDYINGTYYANRPTNLSIANTIAHEIIHAYLISITKAYQYHNEQELLNIEIICDAYEEYLKNHNPEILPNAHHEYIADKYVNSIAATIKEFHTGSSSYSSTGLADQVYRDLAWAGLFDTTIFNEKYPNDPNDIHYAERTRILDRFYAERNGTTRGQSITQGKPCPK